MAKKQENEDDTKLFAFLAVLLNIVGFVIALAFRSENKYVMFYAKQSFVLFIMIIIAWILSGIVGWIPILGWLIIAIVNALLIGLWVVGLIYSLSGKMKDIPFVGGYAKRMNF